MTRIISLIRLIGFIFCANLISFTFVVLCRFTQWDIAATVTTSLLSACIIQVETAKNWSCYVRQTYLNILIISVIVAGASAFFWFFHMIYKIGHYQGDATEILWIAPTRLIALGVSIYLVYTSRCIYGNLTMELSEVELATEDNVEPLSKTLSPLTRIEINRNLYKV